MNAATACVVLAVAATGAAGPRDAGVVVEVEAGPHGRRGTPVVLPVPDALAAARRFVLRGLDDHKPVDAQAVPGDRPGVAWLVNLPAGASRRYRLQADDRGPAAAGVSCTDSGKALELSAGGRTVLRYRHAVAEPPAGVKAFYRRSGFIHPLCTPSGLVVTDDFPLDHPHQHGLFFAWVDATFAGHPVDFWNQAKGTGNVRHAAVLSTAGGPVFGEFSVRLRHEDLTGPDGPTPVLDEVWTVRAYDTVGPFLVDFESRQACGSWLPLGLNAYHYGGFGLRGNRAWLDPSAAGDNPPDPARSGGSDFLTSEGKRRADGNHTRPRWVDLSGAVDGRVGGVAVLDHPENFRFPQPVRLHPNKPYFCFAPTALGPFEVALGSPYVSRYRLVLHDGPADPEALDRLWRDFAEPPRARVVDVP